MSKTINQKELEKILKKHLSWLYAGKSRGEQAHLSRANLWRANLSGTNLSEANLSRANLSEAHLSEANLSRANLNKTDLNGADFKNVLNSFILSGDSYIWYIVNFGDHIMIQAGCHWFTVEEAYKYWPTDTFHGKLCRETINFAVLLARARGWKV